MKKKENKCDKCIWLTKINEKKYYCMFSKCIKYRSNKTSRSDIVISKGEGK